MKVPGSDPSFFSSTGSLLKNWDLTGVIYVPVVSNWTMAKEGSER